MASPSRLFNRNFLLLWHGQLISKLGSEAHSIALMFWVKHATGSAALMGTILMLATLPRVIVGPFAGAYADRHSRRSIIIIADVVCGVTVLSMAILLFVIPEHVSLLLVWMFVVTAAVSAASAFFGPAFSAAIPDIVPKDRVAGANSANAAMTQISGLVGSGVGGVLFRVLGAPLLFLFDALSYVIAAVFSSFTQIPQHVTRTPIGFRDTLTQIRVDVKEGFRYVWKQDGLRSLFIFAATINFFFTPIGVLAPFFVEDTLHSTSDWFGYMMASMGAGAMLGFLGAGSLKLSGKTRSKVVVTGIILMSAMLGATGLMRTPLQLVILVFFTGMANGYININIATILQLTTPSEMRGRVFGLLGTLAAGLTPIAMGLSGVVADLVGRNIPAIFITCGVIATAVSVAISFSPAFRKYLAFEAAEPAIIEAEQADLQSN